MKIFQKQFMLNNHLNFEDHNFLDYIFKLHKVLYVLKQAPHAWYERLNKFLIENGFAKRSTDTALFLKKKMMTCLLCKFI